MSASSNLKRRGAVYYARQVVPSDLREAVGKRELQQTLNTRDLRTAEERKLHVLSEWQRQFDDLRSRRGITESDFAGAAWQHYEREMPSLARTSVLLRSPRH